MLVVTFGNKEMIKAIINTYMNNQIIQETRRTTMTKSRKVLENDAETYAPSSSLVRLARVSQLMSSCQPMLMHI